MYPFQVEAGTVAVGIEGRQWGWIRKRGREMVEGPWKEMRGERKGNKSIGNDRGEVTVIEVNGN